MEKANVDGPHSRAHDAYDPDQLVHRCNGHEQNKHSAIVISKFANKN